MGLLRQALHVMTGTSASGAFLASGQREISVQLKHLGHDDMQGRCVNDCQRGGTRHDSPAFGVQHEPPPIGPT
jgi:hypothetical protein